MHIQNQGIPYNILMYRKLNSLIHLYNFAEDKNKILFVCSCLPTHQNPPYPHLGQHFYFIIIFFSNWQIYYDHPKSRTNMPKQKVQTQIRLLQGAV